MTDFRSIGVIGGGAWGTALAQTLTLGGSDVLLWAREPDVVDDINAHHANSAFLPGVALDPRLAATTRLADIAGRDVVLMVAPAQHVRAVAMDLAPGLAAGKPVVVCAKGLEQATGKLMGDVLAEALPEVDARRALGSEFRRRRGARLACSAHPRLRRRGPWRAARRRTWLPPLPALLVG